MLYRTTFPHKFPQAVDSTLSDISITLSNFPSIGPHWFAVCGTVVAT